MSMNYYDDVPDLSVVERILELKELRKAVVIAHNYQSPEIQFVADYVGDTLAMSMYAAKVQRPVIVVCGPDFMVETVKIIAPAKTVLYANPKAICPMAAMITLEEMKGLRKAHPNARVVGYLNTTAECKCEMDICCTSSNAVKITRSMDTKEIVFVPDQNLGSYVKKHAPEKEMTIWPGFCTVHQMITKRDILGLIRAHPEARVIVHPECTPDVVDMADAVLSTDGMLKYAANPAEREFIVATELEMVNAMAVDNPDKAFYPVEKAYCRTQKKVKLQNVLGVLETLQPEVDLPLDVIRRAKVPVERMLAHGRGD